MAEATSRVLEAALERLAGLGRSAEEMRTRLASLATELAAARAEAEALWQRVSDADLAARSPAELRRLFAEQQGELGGLCAAGLEAEREGLELAIEAQRSRLRALAEVAALAEHRHALARRCRAAEERAGTLVARGRARAEVERLQSEQGSLLEAWRRCRAAETQLAQAERERRATPARVHALAEGLEVSQRAEQWIEMLSSPKGRVAFAAAIGALIVDRRLGLAGVQRELDGLRHAVAVRRAQVARQEDAVTALEEDARRAGEGYGDLEALARQFEELRTVWQALEPYAGPLPEGANWGERQTYETIAGQLEPCRQALAWYRAQVEQDQAEARSRQLPALAGPRTR